MWDWIREAHGGVYGLFWWEEAAKECTRRDGPIDLRGLPVGWTEKLRELMNGTTTHFGDGGLNRATRVAVFREFFRWVRSWHGETVSDVALEETLNVALEEIEGLNDDPGVLQGLVEYLPGSRS